jgi:signal peptidase I
MNPDPNQPSPFRMLEVPAPTRASGSVPNPASPPARVTLKTKSKGLFWKAMLLDLRQRLPLLVGLFLCCSASYFLASRYMVCTVVIRGRSMSPTLRDGDQYLLNRIAYLFRQPRRGDLVVIHDPGHSDMAIKRIVGLPGDCIEVKAGVLYLNHERLSEPYLAPHTATLPGTACKQLVLLKPEQYFVMGDNREESEDSRFYGPIRLESIVGVVSL